MIKRLIISVLIALSFCAVTLGIPPVGSNNGGCWSILRQVSFTSGMGTIRESASGRGVRSAVLISSNYYTMIDSLLPGDSLYTFGLDSIYKAFDPDSAGADTTALYLDGYVDQTIDIAVWFCDAIAETLMITVEQALRYNREAHDSCTFDYGFFTTDTLFTDNDVTAPGDTTYVPNVSASGELSRQFRDTFTLIYPCMRLKLLPLHSGDNTGHLDAIHIEMYCRHTDTVMGGSSGRLIQQTTTTFSPPRGGRER